MSKHSNVFNMDHPMATLAYAHLDSTRLQEVMELAPYPFAEGVYTSLDLLLRRAMRDLGMCRVDVDVQEDGPGLDVLVGPHTQLLRFRNADKLIRRVVCQTADACTVSLNRYLNSSNTLGTPGLDTTMTCSPSPFVYSSSHLSCSVVQPTVQALFPGDTTLTITRKLNASLTPGGESTLNQAGLTGGDGVAYAQLWLDGVEQFYCRAEGCVQNAGEGGNGSTWDCPTLECTCRPGAAFCGGGQVGSHTETWHIARN